MILTYNAFNKLRFPVYIIPHDGWSRKDGILFIDGMLLDDRNVKGSSLGNRRLTTSYPYLYPIKRQLNSIQGVMKQKEKNFIDSNGVPFTYEKTKFLKLKYIKIKEVILKENKCLLRLEKTLVPFEAPRPPDTEYQWAGVLYLYNVPFILYEFSRDKKKDSRRKI